MPLDAEDETMACTFDPFDDAVLGDGVGDEPFAESAHRLVMSRVDLKTGLLDDRSQARAVRNPHAVAAVVFLVALLMFASFGYLPGDVLVKCAAENDVERLRAAADAENR